jgi:hypothetical protein
MKSGPYKINFAKAAVQLADNEKMSLWDRNETGTISRREDTIFINGIWRISAIGNFLGGGLLGVLLIRPFFRKTRAESISVQHVERVAVSKKKLLSGKVFHLFQSRDGGKSEVHVFTAFNENNVPDIEEFLKSVVPQERFDAAP